MKSQGQKNSQGDCHSSKKRLMSFMSKTEKHIVTGVSAGQRPASQGEQSKSYILYDTCEKCPLRVYVDLICNDNLKALIISGEPSEDELEEAKLQLVAEFNELCGDGRQSAYINKYREIMLYKSQILGLTVCARLLSKWEYDNVFEYLNQTGLTVKKVPDSEAEWIRLGRRIESRIKMLRVKIKEAIKQCNNLAGRSENGSKPTLKDFNDQLVQISKNAGFRLTMDITLLEYAGYLKDYNNTLNSLQKEYAKYRK